MGSKSVHTDNAVLICVKKMQSSQVHKDAIVIAAFQTKRSIENTVKTQDWINSGIPWAAVTQLTSNRFVSITLSVSDARY